MRRYVEPSSWIVPQGLLLSDGLRQAAANRHRVLCVVDERGRLVGMLSSGDVYRAVERAPGSVEDMRVSDVMSTRPTAAYQWEAPSLVQPLLLKGIDVVPILDVTGRVVAVVTDEEPQLEVGDQQVGLGHQCLVVAEVGNNHQGDVGVAVNLAEASFAAGADAVKFQLRSGSADVMNPRDLGTEYVDDLLSRYNLSFGQMHDVLAQCKERGIPAFCTPWDIPSLRFLLEEQVPAIKIASADLTNSDLVAEASASGIPLILSTGMSSEDEIRRAIQPLTDAWVRYALLHTNSTYPAMPSQINLKYMDRLRVMSNSVVGYSSHDLGLEISLAAVAMGAAIVEKHVTFDKDQEGNDHRVSLEPSEFAQLVEGVRRVEEALGSDAPRQLSQGEVLNRQALSKSLIWVSDLHRGQTIRRDSVRTVSGGGGVTPDKLTGFVGRQLTRSVREGSAVSLSDVLDVSPVKRSFTMRANFGIPVRFHDYAELTRGASVDLVEYHLSYRDLSVDVQEWLSRNPQRHQVVVHSPELFEADHILDLASADPVYLRESLRNLDRVVGIATKLWLASNADGPVRVIVNAGGWSMNGFIPDSERERELTRVIRVLDTYQKRYPDLRLLVQTMPPFPWHFGGQRFHNLFVSPDDLHRLRDAGFGICLDLSHSQLAADHLGRPLSDFFVSGGTSIEHLHVSDASPPAEEGLPVGQGKIDFKEVAHLYRSHCPDASFIAEVWQGHKEEGLLTWLALESLEAAGF